MDLDLESRTGTGSGTGIGIGIGMGIGLVCLPMGALIAIEPEALCRCWPLEQRLNDFV